MRITLALAALCLASCSYPHTEPGEQIVRMCSPHSGIGWQVTRWHGKLWMMSSLDGERTEIAPDANLDQVCRP